MNGWGRRLFVLLLTTTGVTACEEREAPPPPPPPTVTASQPIVREVVEWDEFTGRLAAVDTVELRARVSGLLMKADFQEGTLVKKGDLLFVIDPRPYAAALKQAQGDLERAQAQFALAETEFKRLDELRASQAVSGTEYETQRQEVAQGRAAITRAQGAVEAARLNEEFTEVRSPIDGRVSRKNVTPGNFVNGGEGQATLLTTITSIDPIYCYVDADERSLLKYQRLAREKKRASAREVQIPAYLSLADETDFPREGVIDFVDNRLNPGTGTLTARAVFDNGDGVLTPGLFGRLRVPGTGRYEALLVPAEAIGADQNSKFVMVVAADDTVQQRPIETGADFDGMRVVTRGLKPDEWIIVNGLLRVRPGMKVNATRAAIPDRDIRYLPDDAGAATRPATTQSATTQSATRPATQPATRPDGGGGDGAASPPVPAASSGSTGQATEGGR